MGCCCSSQETPAKKKVDVEHRGTYNRIRKKRERDRDSEKEVAKREEDRYVAMWDYEKGSPAELSFRKGDVFKEIIDQGEAGPEWLFVTKEGTSGGNLGTGYIPRNMVVPSGGYETLRWHFGDTSREDAVALLRGQPTGTFIVRDRRQLYSELKNKVLSVSHEGRVRHYRIENDFDGTFYVGRRKFNSVPDVIKRFQNDPQGICCRLTEPPEKPQPPRSVLSADVQKRWQEISRTQIRIECEIGKGFYGIVYRGIWEPMEGVKLQVAVKELKPGSAGDRDQFLCEAVLMKNLVHKRLVKLYGVVSAEEPFWIITEFILGGSLKSYLKMRAREGRFLKEHQLVDIALQVSEGMHFLQKMRIVHRDLAARNVLIQEVKQQDPQHEEKFDVKIADFGLAHMMKGDAMREKQELTLATKWVAPEALREGKFSGMTTNQARKHVLDEQRVIPRADSVPTKVFDLIMACCDFTLEARPTFGKIIEHLERFYEKDQPYDAYQKRAPPPRR